MFEAGSLSYWKGHLLTHGIISYIHSTMWLYCGVHSLNSPPPLPFSLHPSSLSSLLLPFLLSPHPLYTGALIYLLHLFCNSQDPTVREETASLLAKMITDKLVGPKVRIVLSKFLPVIFMDAMRDNSEASVHMFESESHDEQC